MCAPFVPVMSQAEKAMALVMEFKSYCQGLPVYDIHETTGMAVSFCYDTTRRFSYEGESSSLKEM